MIIRATYINQSFQPGLAIEMHYAQENGLPLNEKGHVANNTAVTFVVGGVPYACFWNGWGSIKGPNYPNDWFSDVGIGHEIVCTADPAANAVVVVAVH